MRRDGTIATRPNTVNPTGRGKSKNCSLFSTTSIAIWMTISGDHGSILKSPVRMVVQVSSTGYEAALDGG
jgi:hypothetical protein